METNTVYVKTEHVIGQQEQMERIFLEEYQAGNYTFEKPYIKVNPYGIAPLTALLMFRTEETMAVTLRIHGKEAQGDIVRRFEKAKEHVLPVYGLYGGRENRVTLTDDNGRCTELCIRTEPLPESVKRPVSIETTAEYMDGMWMFVSPTTTASTAAYDYRGDCRWYLTLITAFDIKLLKNGRLMIGSYRLYSLPYHLVGVMEMELLGKVYREYTLPYGYHHDEFEREDGNLYVLTSDLRGGTEEDVCSLIDRETGMVLKSWDLKDYLDPNRVAGSPDWTYYGWFRNNAMWYDEKTDRLLLGGRFSEVVACIDCKENKLLWLLGDPDTWEQELVDRYFFRPEQEEGEFEWFYEPHSCTLLPNGDIFLFDNGHYRSKRPEKRLAAKDNYSRGVIYRIDEEKRTVKQIWQFGKERGSDFFSPYISNVVCYEDGWYMVHAGGMCWMDGEPAEKISSALDYKSPACRLDSATVEIRDGRILYEMHLPASFYRARKLPVYTSHLEFGPGRILGQLSPTEEFETEIDDVELTGEAVPERYCVRIQEEPDRIIFGARFEKGQLVMLILEDKDGKNHNYYVSTARSISSTMCVATYLDDDERKVWVPVSKTGLKGRYHIYLIVDSEKYDLHTEILA